MNSNRAMVACLWIVLAFMYIPIIAIIGMSFNATPYGMFPYVFTFDWYKILFTESNLLPACVFSLKFAFGVTVAAIIIGTMASFAGLLPQVVKSSQCVDPAAHHHPLAGDCYLPAAAVLLYRCGP